MASRMDRYSKTASTGTETSRLQKNSSLYNDFRQNAKYTEYSESANTTAIDLTNIKEGPRNRENYQKAKDVELLFDNMSREKKESLTYILDDEEKIYDINSVLADAKKNRQNADELERKRKLRNAEFNILTSIEKKQLEQEELAKKKRDDSGLDPEESDSLKELINTIYDARLAKEIISAKEKLDEVELTDEEDSDITNDLKPVVGNKNDAALLSDLMPSDNTETILTDEISKDIIANQETENTLIKDAEMDNTLTKETKIDKSFYTRSMDLTAADFSDEDEFVEKGNPLLLFLKIFFAIVLVLGIGILIFFLINQM